MDLFLFKQGLLKGLGGTLIAVRREGSVAIMGGPRSLPA